MDQQSARVFLPDAQQNWWKEYETDFNDRPDTIFGQHRFGFDGMFSIVREMRSEQTARIARDLDRDYDVVLTFVHEVQDVCGEIDVVDSTTCVKLTVSP